MRRSSGHAKERTLGARPMYRFANMRHTSLSRTSVQEIWLHSTCKTRLSSNLPRLACWQLVCFLDLSVLPTDSDSSSGCAPAMISFKLRGDALMHCLRISGAVILLLGGDSGWGARVDEEAENHKRELHMRIIRLSEDLKREIGRGEALRIGDQYWRDICGDTPIALLYTRYVHFHQS